MYDNKTKSKTDQNRIGTGKCFGTFGELLQGVLEDGNDFLITFPVALFTRATFISNPNNSTVTVTPASKSKAKNLARMIMEHFGLSGGGTLNIDSDLPIGKGFASSSADMVATARAVADCFDIEIPVTLLQRLMSRLETSDGVMYPGIVSFFNKRVELIEQFDFLPPLTIVGVDDGGEVDTLHFHKQPKNYTMEDKKRYRQMLNILSEALRQEDLATIGSISSESAWMNQKVNPARFLEHVAAICREVKGLGIVKAHTGTCSGILLANDDPAYEWKLNMSKQRLQEVCGEASVYHSLCGQKANHSK